MILIQKSFDAKKFKIYLEGEDKVRNHFDFLNVIRTGEEFEQLKKLLLSNNLQMSFELTYHPKIELNETVETSKKNTEIIEEQLQLFLSKFLNKSSSQMDDNLLKLLLEAK